MNYVKIVNRSAVVGSMLLSIACSSGKDKSSSGVEAAFATRAAWVSDCTDSDRFGLTMHSRFDINGDSFRKTNRYYSDGSCSDLAIETVETGVVSREAAQGATGSIDFKYDSVRLVPMGPPGVLALNAVTYCGSNSWQLEQSRDLTNLSGGESCWDRTPRVVHDIYQVSGSQIYFGAGTDKQKGDIAASRPTALDESRPWKIQ